MSNIDNRIVQMQMNNSQFTNAANSTMNTLKKLGDSLKLTEGVKGLDNITKKAKDVDMSGISAGVDAVKSRFSALEVIGVTTLVNITNSAVNAGKRMLSALTLDPITSGFTEYETKMNAITTILTNTASKGTKLSDVTATLDELNLYADQTIYNFAEMTRNIGTFTAAGVDLETSATAIKGIANLAAGSGSSSQQASTAMYQLSQALAAGSLKLQDWNSVVNAGMGGELFQKALEKTAASLGAGRDMSVSFRESLQDGWITTEVLTKTLQDFAADESLLQAATQVKTYTQLIDTMKESVQSGWGQSWENILGDKDEAAALFTAISDGFNNIAGPMADYRNEALKYWKEQGGREAIINGMANVLKSIGNLLGPIYNAFKKIIDPWNGERLVSLSKGFEKLTEKLKVSDKAAEYIGKTFEGVFSIFKIGGLLLKPLGSLITGLGTAATPILDVFFKFTSSLTNWVASASNALEASGYIEKAMQFMLIAGEATANFLDKLFTNGASWISTGLDYAKTYIDEFVVVMGDLVVAGSAKISEIKDFALAFNESFRPMEKAKDFVVNIFNGIQNGIQGFVDFTKDSIKTIRQFFDSIVTKVKESNIQGIDLVNAGLFASLLLVVKKLIPFLKNFFGAVGDFKDSFIGVLDSLQSTLESYQKSIKSDVIKKIAIAIGILAASIWVLSKIDPERLLPAVAALGSLTVGLVFALKAFDKIDPKEFPKTASTIVALIGISISLNILASAMSKLSGLKWDEILKSIIGLGAACAAVFALTKTLKGADINPATGAAMILIATSLYVLAGALALLGALDSGKIFKSLTTIAIVMTGLSLFFKSTKGIDNSVKIAVSLIPLTTSLILLAGALAIFGNMSIGTLQQGFIVLALALTELSLFTNSMRGFQGNMLSIGAGLLLLSGALLVLSGVLGILGNMDIHTLTQGLSAMALALSVLAITLNVMPKNTIGIATGLTILAGGMLILSLGLKALGGLEWESIGKGLLTLVTVLVILGGAALLLGPVAPIMLAIAGALAVFGLAAGLVAGSFVLLSVGITMLSGSVVGAGLAITTALLALASVIPVMAAAIALGLVSFITVLGYNAVAIERALTQLLAGLLNTVIANIPLFVKAVHTFLSEIMKSLSTLFPQLVNMVVTFLVSVMNAIITLTPKIVQTVMTLLMSILQALSDNIPIIVKLVLDSLVNIITNVLTGLAEAVPKIASGIVNIIVAIINAIGTNVPIVVNAMYDMIIKMINGLADAVETKTPEVRAAIKRLVTAIINEFKAAVKDAVSVGGDIINGLKNGISNGIESVKNAAKNVASSALSAAKNFLGIHSPSRAFEEVGMYSDQGMAKGFTSNGDMVENAAVGVADNALSGMQKAMSGISDVFNSDLDNQPVIRPVMDLSNIQNGANQIGGMMNGDYAIRTSINAARQASSGILANSTVSDTQPVSTTNNYSTTPVTNTFNVTSNNPREFAEEVSRIIQTQVERRNMVWE